MKIYHLLSRLGLHCQWKGLSELPFPCPPVCIYDWADSQGQPDKPKIPSPGRFIFPTYHSPLVHYGQIFLFSIQVLIENCLPPSPSTTQIPFMHYFCGHATGKAASHSSSLATLSALCMHCLKLAGTRSEPRSPHLHPETLTAGTLAEAPM